MISTRANIYHEFRITKKIVSLWQHNPSLATEGAADQKITLTTLYDDVASGRAPDNIECVQVQKRANIRFMKKFKTYKIHLRPRFDTREYGVYQEGAWQIYKGSLGEGRTPCIKNGKGVWERELH